MKAHTLNPCTPSSNFTNGYHYTPFGQFTIGDAIPAWMYVSQPCTGKFLTFYVKLGAISGSSHRFTLDRGGVPTAMVVDIMAGDLEGICSVPLDVAASDLLTVRYSRIAGVTNPAGGTGWVFDFQPSSGECISLLSGLVRGRTGVADIFALPQQAYGNADPYLEEHVSCVAPCPLIIKNLYNYQANGAFSGFTQLTLRKNGVDTALACTTHGVGYASDTTHQISLAKGDLFNLRNNSWDDDLTRPISQFGMAVVLPKKSYCGLDVQASGTGAGLPDLALTNYGALYCKWPTAGWGDLIGGWRLLSSLQTLVSLYIALKTAPGVGASWTFTVMLDGVTTVAEVIISGLDTVGEWTGTVDIPLAGLLNLRSVPVGPPAATNLAISSLFKHTIWNDLITNNNAKLRVMVKV